MSIYHLKNNTWCDYVEEQQGIMKLIDGEWVDGASNQNLPPISIHIAVGNKFVQKYPKAHITYTDTYKASGLKFTHSKSTSAWGTDTSRGDAKAGIWTSGAIYTGWLGLKSPAVSGGKGNVSEILNVNVKYNRRGVGNWEIEYPLALVLSSLTSATGGGYNAHYNTKKLKTFYSDSNMLVCTGTSAERVGETTMNNANAKAMLKEWLNSSSYSILLGYKESSGTPYIGLYGLELEITYTCNISKATFKNIPVAYNVERNSEGDAVMWIYDDELDLTFEEIIEHRERLGRSFIKEEDVEIETR